MSVAKDPFFGTRGPRSAPIMVVGEAWGYEESAEQKPFVGHSGKELERMLVEAGIDIADCFFTNVVAARPPNNDMWQFFYPAKGSPVQPLRGLHPMPIVMEGLDALQKQIAAVQPKVILALGNYALWALTGCAGYSAPSEAMGRRVPTGIMQWRGSLWYTDALPSPLDQIHLVPAIHPAAIIRAWYNRACTVHDLRQRVRIQGLSGDWRLGPAPTFLAPPSYRDAVDVLSEWLDRVEQAPMRLMNDIETARGLITCIGFADGNRFAMAIPFVNVTPGQPFDSFYTQKEEFHLVSLMRKLLAHPNCKVEGQNYLYDIQYLARYLALIPNFDFDSMAAHHLLFPGTPKSLDYLSSLYCKYHYYWKEDHKEWDMRGTINSLLTYNCIDTTQNFEVNTVLRDLIPKMGQATQWVEEMEKQYLALDMMRRGVAIDTTRRGLMQLELLGVAGDYAQWFHSIVPQEIATPDKDPRKVVPWFQSPTQQKDYFRDILGFKLPINRKTDRETFGHEALQTLTEKYPEFAKLFTRIEEFRSIRVFKNTFADASLDFDNRMRCMYNTSGTETFRWSSSENAFGGGTNLQNIPKGEEE